MTERNRARRELQIKWSPKRRSRRTLHGEAADASDRFRSRAAGCYTVRDAVPQQTAGSTHACGCRVTEQNDRQRRRERESPICVKGKDDFKPRVHSLSIVSFWMVPAVDMGLRLTKIQDLLRGAWRDRDTNDIFAHCSLIFYFLDLKFSNFVCPSVLHRLIWFFLKNSFRKKKNIRKTTRNALAPCIFIVLSIALKLGTPLLHTQAQKNVVTDFLISLQKSRYGRKTSKSAVLPYPVGFDEA